MTRDVMSAATVLTNLAITYALTGETDLAIKQLDELVRIPSPVSYGHLRLHPFWDLIRIHPGLQQLLTMKDHFGP